MCDLLTLAGKHDIDKSVLKLSKRKRELMPMKQWILALTITLMLLPSLYVHAAVDSKIPENTQVTTFAADIGISDYSKQLSPKELDLYQLILSSFKARQPSFTHPLNPPLDVTSDGGTKVSSLAYRAFEAVYRDHPEIFWVTKAGGMKISLNIVQNGAKSEANGISMTVEFHQPESITQKQAKLETAVAEILSGAPSGTYEKIKYFHGKLTEICAYDEQAKKQPSSYPDAYESYGALVNHKAVCEGYAKAFKLLCDRSGIASVLVGGTGNNEAHMWNYVNIAGNYYMVDATFDDPINGTPTQNFLLKGSESTAATHKPASGFLQGFQSGFEDPILSLKDYVPTTGSTADIAKDTTVIGSSNEEEGSGVKKYCTVTYSQSKGGTFIVSYIGVAGALDQKQSVLNGVTLSVRAFPSNGYKVSEIKANMSVGTASATDRDSLDFTVIEDCNIQVTFQK